MPNPDLDSVFKQYGDWWCKEHGGKCDRMNPVQSGYEDRRLVISDMRAEYYDEPKTEMIPQVGAKQVLTNRTSVEQSQTVSLSKTTTSTFTWSLQEGFKIGMSVKFAVGVPPIASAETTISGELSFSATETKTSTEQRSWQVNQPIKVPANTEVEATLFVDERKFSQRFHSKCTLSGYVCSNSPDRIDGHYFWFHSVRDIFTRFPQPGFRVSGNVVLYEGDGMFEGLMGIRTRLDITERALGGDRQLLRSFSIPDPINGAGVAGVHDLVEM
ncbi:ETX/MTX2 family pore-forming toxin [Paracoccus aestuariivivens]|uniref:Uncharacterized protein n=1 Tax=Paracoccus aestuariivivens TaxID=1820333 RepID=A0A6L6JFJ9_9RHOB|nr:ETX/MTX2 family pore-forming toxin [Paracoccus aestuariivivens]MTH79357.1 hypothetical protein [Paracoccus aestuariivivens]